MKKVTMDTGQFVLVLTFKTILLVDEKWLPQPICNFRFTAVVAVLMHSDSSHAGLWIRREINRIQLQRSYPIRIQIRPWRTEPILEKIYGYVFDKKIRPDMKKNRIRSKKALIFLSQYFIFLIHFEPWSLYGREVQLRTQLIYLIRIRPSWKAGSDLMHPFGMHPAPILPGSS